MSADNKGKEAYIILFLSDNKDNAIEKNYKLKDGTATYAGVNTDDAPIRYLMDVIKNDERELTKVICISSYADQEKLVNESYPDDLKIDFVGKKIILNSENQKAKGKKNSEGNGTSYSENLWDSVLSIFKKREKTTEISDQQKDATDSGKIVYKSTTSERFSNFVKAVGKSKGFHNIDIKEIPYDYAEENGKIKEKEDSDLPKTIYQQLEKVISSDASVYVDYTGGMRDISFLMVSIIRFLEFNNVSCRKIVYSKYDPNNDGTIYELDYIYEMYQLINGVSEFLSTGSVQILSRFARNTVGKELNDFIQSVENFSDCIYMCNLGKLDEVKQEFITALKNIANLKETESNIFVPMFQSLVPEIRKAFYMQEKDSNFDFTYPQLIKWCADNGLIMQALSIYIEKMPKYYFELDKRENIFPQYVKDIWNENNSGAAMPLGHEKDYEIFFTDLYDKSARGLGNIQFTKAMKDINEELDQIGGRKNKWKKLTLTDITGAIQQQINDINNDITNDETKYPEYTCIRDVVDALSRFQQFLTDFYMTETEINQNNATSTNTIVLKVEDGLANKLAAALYPKKTKSREFNAEMAFSEWWTGYYGLASEESPTAHRFVEGDYSSDVYQYDVDKKAEYEACNGNGTYAKKIMAIKKISKGVVETTLKSNPAKNENTMRGKIRLYPLKNEQRERLVNIMKYYLAVKVIRNRMDHASETGATADEINLLEFLQSSETGREIILFDNPLHMRIEDISKEKLRKMILDGVALTEL